MPPPDSGAVGLIGLGEIGQVHVAAIRRAPAARLVAVADTAPGLLEPFAAAGVRAYREAAELIADPPRRHRLGLPAPSPALSRGLGRDPGGQERAGGKAAGHRP
jgi:hypothetical protein